MSKVSVIIPTFNRLHTLPRAVASVLNQTFRDLELWIVDDGSTDGTSDWVRRKLLGPEQNEPNIHYMRTSNNGVSHARNAAIRASNSEWIALLDSDDTWMPGKLEKQLQMAKLHPECPLIHGEEIWMRNGVRVNPMKKHQKSGGRIFKNCVPLCCISPSTALIRRSLFDEVGLFNENFPVCEDYEMWLRVTARHPVAFVTTPIVTKYGGHEDQLSRKFVAMDYYRVKALSQHLDSPFLNEEEKAVAHQVLEKKCDILLRGYKRHNNLEYYQEIKSLKPPLLTS